MVTALLRYLRIAPRKVRLVADLVRGKSAAEAQAILNFTTKKASEPILKLLNSALANAKNNFQLDPANLYISKITIDEGPKLKRWKSRARGSAYEIHKKTSHINLVLDEIAKRPKKSRAKKVEKLEELEKVEKIEKTLGLEKPKPRPITESQKPQAVRGIKRIFRRKAF